MYRRTLFSECIFFTQTQQGLTIDCATHTQLQTIVKNSNKEKYRNLCPIIDKIIFNIDMRFLLQHKRMVFNIKKKLPFPPKMILILKKLNQSCEMSVSITGYS